MEKTLSFFAIIIALCLPNVALSQHHSDAGMWNTFSLEKQLTKKFSVELDEEIRLKSNFSQLNLLYTNLYLNYKPFKGAKIGLGYRSIQKYTELETFSYKHRLMLDLTYKYKFSNVILSYRSRFQSEVENFYSSKRGKLPEWFWRNKFELKYDLGKKYMPYVGTELRYQIRDPRSPDWDKGWHRIRTYFGIDYTIDNKNAVGIYYLIQREFAISDPEYIYILGLQYSLSI